MKTLPELFWSFFKIGLFTFGGGYAMLPLIEREVLGKEKWNIEKSEFLDLLTLAQTTPGPIALNVGVFIGYKARGYWGAVVAALGIVVPSFVIILLIAILFADIRHNAVVDAAFKGMRPAVVALILVPVLSLAKGMHWGMIGVIAASALAVWGLGWSPIYLLIAGAAFGILWLLFICKNRTK
ncbi:MAG: chromate transporter [Alistipes sp.]